MDEKIMETQDIFLGTLYENETHRVYGYCPSSRMKFLALYKTSNQIVENQVGDFYISGLINWPSRSKQS